MASICEIPRSRASRFVGDQFFALDGFLYISPRLSDEEDVKLESHLENIFSSTLAIIISKNYPQI